jgi:hypothetical protein
VSKYLDAGHTIEDLMALAETLPIWTPTEIRGVFPPVGAG